MLELIIFFHHYIEFLICNEFVIRFLQNTSNVIFSIKIPENLQKIVLNKERLNKLITE